jgi:hypothetical protein
VTSCKRTSLFPNVDHSAHHNTRLLLLASPKDIRIGRTKAGDNEIQGYKLEKERSLRIFNGREHLDLGETLREERSEFSRALHFILSASLLRRHENEN